MFTFKSKYTSAYTQVAPYIQCHCGNASWKTCHQEATNSFMVFCTNCLRAMTSNQYNAGCVAYKFNSKSAV